MHWFVVFVMLAVVVPVAACLSPGAAQGVNAGDGSGGGPIDPDRRPARTMCHTGADWLERESREQEENPTLMRANLGITPGMVVADIGCGVGYHTVPLAQLVGPTGRVIGTEMQPEYRDRFQARVASAGLNNVEFVVTSGDAADTGLPAGGVDLVLMVDVYHEVAQPQEFLQALRSTLRPGGRLALVEFRAEDPSVPILPDHKMSVAQVDYELALAGYRRTGRFDGLPWQHLLFYEPTE